MVVLLHVIGIQVSGDISSGITQSFMVHPQLSLLIMLLKDNCKGHRLVVALQAAGVSPCPSVQAIGLPILVHRKQNLEEVEL